MSCAGRSRAMPLRHLPLRTEKVNRINIQHHKTEIGELILGSFDGRLCLLGFGDKERRRVIDDRVKKRLDTEFVERNDEILEKTRKQVDQYLTGNRKEFDLPLLMVGTDFQRRVWKALMKIPYGVTSTYRQIAEDIGSPKAIRAVGNANNENPISIIVPCHRIIGSDGKLAGYGGGLSVKRRLLRLEQRGRETRSSKLT
jgi:methylated-DNA-[protein]-cysteine S-methyltransferase